MFLPFVPNASEKSSIDTGNPVTTGFDALDRVDSVINALKKGMGLVSNFLSLAATCVTWYTLHLSMSRHEMLPFPLRLQPGIAISEQLVYAVRKAVISGLLRPGSRFPSVRAISQELRIHPNTAHKAIALLVGEGLLEVHPGIGTVVGQLPSAPTEKELKLLESEVERLVVEAKNRRLTLDQLKRITERQWNRLTHP